MKVSMTKRPSEMEINRCYRCLGFVHMVADFREPDRSNSCRCGEEGHAAGSCTRKHHGDNALHGFDF